MTDAATEASAAGPALSQLQAGPTASRPTYRLLQVLRALAALMVVAHHATIMLHDRNGLPVSNWINGGAGVDIFFVISGFVMTVSSQPLRDSVHPARTFLARRLERIVPMYWIVTTIKVLTVLAAPALALNALGTPFHVLASYLFLPSTNVVGAWEPVVVVGWTLNAEVFFYAVFALMLAFRAPLLRTLAPLLIAVMLLRLVGHQPLTVLWYENSLVVEFLLGVLLARALPLVRRLPEPAAILLFVGGLAVLCCWMYPNWSPWRGLLWGPAAAAVVAAALALEDRWGRYAPRWTLALGDASYSIYLIHGFVLPAFGLLLTRFGAHWMGAVPVSIAVMVTLTMLAGEVVYLIVERPIAHWFKGRRRTAAPALG